MERRGLRPLLFSLRSFWYNSWPLPYSNNPVESIWTGGGFAPYTFPFGHFDIIVGHFPNNPVESIMERRGLRPLHFSLRSYRATSLQKHEKYVPYIYIANVALLITTSPHRPWSQMLTYQFLTFQANVYKQKVVICSQVY